jgi:hypothetical protein
MMSRVWGRRSMDRLDPGVGLRGAGASSEAGPFFLSGAGGAALEGALTAFQAPGGAWRLLAL